AAASNVAPAVEPKETKKNTREMRSKRVPDHPKYSEMITAALEHLNDHGGTSRQALVKYIASNYNLDEKKSSNQLRLALKRLVASGTLKQTKGAGASGSFLLAKAEDEAGKTIARGKHSKSAKKETQTSASTSQKQSVPKQKNSSEKPSVKRAPNRRGQK
ncbi:Linker histone H1/H5 domain H15, partial [Trinorchestia longiramus]